MWETLKLLFLKCNLLLFVFLVFSFQVFGPNICEAEIYFEPYGGLAAGNMPVVVRRENLARYTDNIGFLGPKLGAHIGWFEVYDLIYAFNVETTQISASTSVESKVSGEDSLPIRNGQYSKIGIGMGYMAQNVPFGLHGYFDFLSTLNTFGPGLIGNGFRFAVRYYPLSCCSLALEVDQGYLIKRKGDEYWGSNPTVLALSFSVPFTYDYPKSKWRSRYKSAPVKK